MAPRLIWDVEAATYVRSRGQRYANGQGLEPEWAQEALQDPRLAALEPDPKSRMGASRFVGFSESAARLLTVIALRDADCDLHLINAWPATGADRRLYEEESTHGEDD